MKTRSRAHQAVAMTSEPLSTVTHEIVRDEKSFMALEGEWNRLAQTMACKTPCFEWAYLISWWEVFGRLCPASKRPGILRVIVVRKGQEIIGIAPMFYSAIPRLSLFPRRLRLIGYSGRLEPYDMTEESIVVMAQGMETVVLQEFSRAIGEILHAGECDACVLRWLDNYTPPEPSYAFSRFRQKEGSGYVALPKTWADFRKSLSKSMRDNLPYYGRLLIRQGHEWHVEMADIGPEWDRGVSDLIRLHRLRAWVSKDITRRDHLPADAHKQFLDVVHNAFRGDTRAYIGLLFVDGKVVAAQSYLEDSRTLMLSYSGHDPTWAKYSPLLVLQAEVIKQAIERGTQRLDFLYGMAPWQERWQPKRDHPLNKLAMISKKPLSTIKCSYYLGLREVSVLWERSKIKRRISRSKAIAASQSFMQALYITQGRHIHLLLSLHKLRMHY